MRWASVASAMIGLGRLVGLLVASAFALAPLLWALLLSLKLPVDALSMPPTLVFRPTFAAYKILFADPQFGLDLMNSVVVTGVVAGAATIVGALAGYGLARFRHPASFFVLMGALVLYALPRTALLSPYHELGQLTGLYDTLLLLILAMTAFVQPFTIWLFEAFFRELPEELERAAMLDGCTRLQVLRYIVLPQMGPGLVTGALFAMLFAYNDFLLPVILTSTNASTMPVLIADYAGTSDMHRWPVFAAAAVVVALPAALLILLGQKWVVRGLTAGAVKG